MNNAAVGERIRLDSRAGRKATLRLSSLNPRSRDTAARGQPAFGRPSAGMWETARRIVRKDGADGEKPLKGWVPKDDPA